MNKGLSNSYRNKLEYDGWQLIHIDDTVVEVLPAEASNIDIKTKVKFCERYAKQRQMKLQFKLFESKEMSDLLVWLKQSQYQIVQEQLLMRCNQFNHQPHRLKDVTIKIFEPQDERFSVLKKERKLEEIEIGNHACFCEITNGCKSFGIAFATIKDCKMGIFNVFVESDFRGKGYGKQLVLALFHWASAYQIEYVYLNVDIQNKSAIHLYKQLGFGVETRIMSLRKKEQSC
jgi:ribosomal protein S18 acetylase RimI-like enzyme